MAEVWVRCSRILRSEDKLAHLKFEEERLSAQFNEEEAEICQLSDVIERLTDIQTSSPSLTLEEITDRMWKLNTHFRNEFVLYDIHLLTIPIVFPKVRRTQSHYHSKAIFTHYSM